MLKEDRENKFKGSEKNKSVLITGAVPVQALAVNVCGHVWKTNISMKRLFCQRKCQ